MANDTSLAAATEVASEERTFTLSEVAVETGIAMPILLRYKREQPERIESTGSGSQQRFPESAIDQFQQIHGEQREKRGANRRGGFGLLSLPRAKRGTPEDDAWVQGRGEANQGGSNAPNDPAQAGSEGPSSSGGGSAKASSNGASSGDPSPSAPSKARPLAEARDAASEIGDALTLRQLSEVTGIAYPTVARYASLHTDRIPHWGSGRSRRFPPEAVEVILKIRKESRRGRPPGSGKKKSTARGPAADQLEDRIEALEQSQNRLEKQLQHLMEELQRPLVATVREA